MAVDVLDSGVEKRAVIYVFEVPLPHPAHRRNSQLIKIDSGNGGLKPYAFTPNRDLFDSEVSVKSNFGPRTDYASLCMVKPSCAPLEGHV